MIQIKGKSVNACLIEKSPDLNLDLEPEERIIVTNSLLRYQQSPSIRWLLKLRIVSLVSRVCYANTFVVFIATHA